MHIYLYAQYTKQDQAANRYLKPRLGCGGALKPLMSIQYFKHLGKMPAGQNQVQLPNTTGRRQHTGGSLAFLLCWISWLIYMTLPVFKENHLIKNSNARFPNIRKLFKGLDNENKNVLIAIDLGDFLTAPPKTRLDIWYQAQFHGDIF